MNDTTLLDSSYDQPTASGIAPTRACRRPLKSLALLVFAFSLLSACEQASPKLDAEWTSHPFLRDQILTVRSGEQKPITIKRIVINGEFTVDKVSVAQVTQDFKERTLTIGEATNYSFEYPKRILYTDINTDRGTCRVEFEKVQ